MFAQLFAHLSVLALLLGPLACAGGFAACCAEGAATGAERAACSCGCGAPVEDDHEAPPVRGGDEDRPCIASDTNATPALRSADETARSLATDFAVQPVERIGFTASPSSGIPGDRVLTVRGPSVSLHALLCSFLL